ncbi:MAG: site-specific integrase [Planctomycetes bacterium]|nr:site-specific integrase [Planctomycetota bacterium]
MPRQAKAALGSYTTPFGTAHFRTHATGRGEQVALHVRGSTLVLRWLFQRKAIKEHQQQIYITPPGAHATMDGVTALHAEMVKSWNLRLAREPGGWSTHAAHLGGTGAVTVTLSDLVTRMEAHASATVRASTLKTYRFGWQTILRNLPPATPVTSLNTGMLLGSIGKLQNDGLSAESIRKHIAQLKKLCSFAVQEGLLIQDPSVSIKLPKIARSLPRFLSPDQRDRLLAAAEAKGRDYHLLVACGVYLGLRKAELNALRWTDIDFEKRVAQVVNTEDFTTKSGKPRSIPVCDELLAILQRYRHLAGFVLAPKKKYRPKARYRWEFRDVFVDLVITAKLDVREVSPHVMRHTFASILAQRGVSLFKIGAWMGHSTAQVTELYAHLTAYDEDIRRLNPGTTNGQAIGRVGDQ